MELLIKPADEKMRNFVLVKPVNVEIDGREFTIPKGFITDFASVPKAFWSILPPMGKYGLAALLHDYLYRTGLVSRKEADKLFLKMMKKLGVSRWKRIVMYLAVRVFGGKAYVKKG